jgi:hypothetical protein
VTSPEEIATVGHIYLSTGCLHGEHAYCAGTYRLDGGGKKPAQCKFCDTRCVCSCHELPRRPDPGE